MTNLYDRRFEVLLDDQAVIASADGVEGLQGTQDLRITFEITLDFGGYISYADFGIYNLSEDTAARFYERNVSLGFKAGYVGNVDYLFKGVVSNAFKERDGPNIVTRVLARGGTQPPVASVEKTFGPGVTVQTLIRYCASSMGYPVVLREEDFDGVKPYPRGYVFHGDPRAYMRRLAEAHKFDWTIENDRIVIVKKDSYRRGGAFVVSQFDGMEGIPEITEIGCDVSVRLNPKIRIGGRIDIQSEFATFNFSNLYFQNIPPSAGKGIYRVFSLTHSGDTWGDSWTTRITGYR